MRIVHVLLVTVFGLTSPAYAATIVLTGAAGADGANATSPGQSGGNGGDGESLSQTLVSGDPIYEVTLTGGNGGNGGNGANGDPNDPFGFGGAGGTGGAGGSVSSNITASAVNDNTLARAHVYAGSGGVGGAAGTGQGFTGPSGHSGSGGAADALSTATGIGTASGAVANADATGGNGAGAGAAHAVASSSSEGSISVATASARGGGGYRDGSAGANAVADATASAQGSMFGLVQASADAKGGQASRTPVDGVFGVPGTATATARATAVVGPASASMTQTGGDGAPGDQGPFVSSPLLPGGAGQNSTANNAVSGSAGGLLTLRQVAEGGNGGPNAVGGIATSTLNATNPGGGGLDAQSVAAAGSSGGSYDFTATFFPGGSPATATVTATDSVGAPVSASADAVGGAGGIAFYQGLVGTGGKATATAHAFGLGTVHAQAGANTRTGGMGVAQADATRVGSLSAHVNAGLPVGAVDYLTGQQYQVAQADAGVGNAAPPGDLFPPVRNTAGASLIGLPAQADAARWRAGNPNALAAGGKVFGLGTLYNGVASWGPNLTGSIELDLTTSSVGYSPDLSLAFLDPVASGASLDLLHLSLALDGTTLFDTTFHDTTSALAGLNDLVVHIGRLGGPSDLVHALVLSFELDFLQPNEQGFAVDFAFVPEPDAAALILAAASLLLLRPKGLSLGR